VIRTTALSTTCGHVCWSYDNPAEFESRARDFLAAGLAAGEQAWYVTPGRPEHATDRMRGLDGFQEALHRGAAKVVALDATYSYDYIVDPPEQVRSYAAATEGALAAGYTGFRVVAEATSLVRTPAQLEAFARYEYLIDRYMRTHSMSAMCGYDRRALGDSVIAQLACMHPQNNVDEVLFRLHACNPGDGCAALAGELDLSNHELFSTALDRADLRPTEGELVVQATNLRFIDHRSLLHLRDLARRREATVVLRTSGSAPARLVALLNLSEVRVEAAL
jgi:anti-anti-sigma regulatory factor